MAMTKQPQISTPQSSPCVCNEFYQYRHYSSQVILTQHLQSLQKIRGRGHSSAQLWKITINSLLQIVHAFQGNRALWGTFTPYSQLGQELPEGYPKNLSPYFIRTKKPNPVAAVRRCYFIIPFNSCWTPLSTVCTSRTSVMHHPSWWQVSSVLQISISFLLLFKLHRVSWVEPVFWMPSHFLNTSANSTKSVKGLSARLWRNPGLTSSSWLLLLCQRSVCLCFPLVFKAALYCVLLHLIFSPRLLS